MVDKKKEGTLIECLKWCQVASLPEKDDEVNIWIKAIALVQKADGSENYVAMVKDNALNNKIVKDFGNISLVRKVKEIYPYSYLSAAYVPEFKTKKKEERIAWLNKYDNSLRNLGGLTLKELDKKVISIAIKTQMSKEKQGK